MKEIVLQTLKDRGLVLDSDLSTAKNSISVHGNEVVLKGNKLGLVLLAEYMIQVALSNSPGHHVHLDMDSFFDEGSGELIIVLEE